MEQKTDNILTPRGEGGLLSLLVRYCLHHRLVVLLGVLLAVVSGFMAAQRMDIDVFPDLTAPTVVVMTDCHGMAADEVERLVTFPIETALNGATGVRRVRSASNGGSSYVWAEFDWGADVFRARQIVSEKMVTLAESLPEGVTPQLAPQSSVMGEILFVGLLSDSTATADSCELRSLADWVVKPAILSAGGVSQVTVIGGYCKQYQVLADAGRMAAYGVSIDEVRAAVQSMSENVEGGVLRDYGNEYVLRGMARTSDLATLAATPVHGTLCLGDIATIKAGAAVRMGTASVDGKPAVILSVSKQPGINTLEVTKAIEARLGDLSKTLPEGVRVDPHLFRQADFISASVDNVGRALLEGAALCIAILFLFLGSPRCTLISVVAIPLSLLATLTVLWLLGMDINTMTLGGMCIAIGSLVDDAIIDVENVHRRLRQGAASLQDALRIIFEASCEIRSSIISATLIVIVAFAPMFFLSGMEGRMLRPLGLTFIIAIAMSLIVAMTVTPLLCRLLLTGRKALAAPQAERAFVTRMKAAYASSLVWVLAHGRAVLGATALAFAASLALMLTFGSSFLPAFNEGALTIQAASKPGISLQESDLIGRMLEQRIMEVPEVTRTSRRTGRGELDEHSQTTNACEIDVSFSGARTGRSAEEITQDVRQHMARVPGVTYIVGQPIGHRIDHMISGTRASIAIKIFGTDLSEMMLTGQRIKQAIGEIEGLVDISIDQQVETPQIQLRPRRMAMARHGFPMEEFQEIVPLVSPAGLTLGDIYEGQRRYDLVLRLTSGGQEQPTLDGMPDILIPTGEPGNAIPLSDLCEVVSTQGPNAIQRENVQRKLVVAANVSGRDVGSVVREIQERVAQQVQLPEGYRVEYGGQFESAQKATRTILLASLLALLGIFGLLYMEFRSLSLSAIVMLGLPMALMGGALAIAMTSGVLSLPAIIGFITLFGIATRNSILLISHMDAMPHDMIRACQDRLNPILMTALTSALALVPMVLASDRAGNEIQSPMAIVVLGGLLSSTLLNLFVMPVIYETYRRKHPAA